MPAAIPLTFGIHQRLHQLWLAAKVVTERGQGDPCGCRKTAQSQRAGTAGCQLAPGDLQQSRGHRQRLCVDGSCNSTSFTHAFIPCVLRSTCQPTVTSSRQAAAAAAGPIAISFGKCTLSSPR
ncbi:hypothetical protein D3C73_1410890 [compost metagenome]